jgi:hypothetical protein
VYALPDDSTSKRQIEWKFYSGELSLGVDTLAVTFRAGADASGEIELEFEPIKLDEESKFIFLKWHDEDNDGMIYFSLSGLAEDGTRFETSHLSFNSLGKFSNASGTTMRPEGRCSKPKGCPSWQVSDAVPVRDVRCRGKSGRGAGAVRLPLLTHNRHGLPAATPEQAWSDTCGESRAAVAVARWAQLQGVILETSA